MNHYLESVEEFHECFEHPVHNEIQEDNLELRKLRLGLIFEEMVELAQAMGCTRTLEELCDKHATGTHRGLFNGEEAYDGSNYNKKETLDAFADIQYVLSGGVLSLGYTEVFDDAFDEVHRSNMSKLCETPEEAEETIEYHRKERGETQLMSIVQKDDMYIVVREDGKIMKSKYYSKADLSKFVE